MIIIKKKKMKIALVTGANRSIGLEIAKQLSTQDIRVYLGSRTLSKGEEVVQNLTKEGYQNITAIEIDVTSANSILAAKNQIETAEGKLDILINNAGILGINPQSASDTAVAEIKAVFETNFFGVIQVSQAFLPLLKKSDSPRISNITSGLASLTLHSDPSWKYYQVKNAAYGPSKTALNAYTVTLAYELRELGFKVNAIDPGYTATDFNHHSGPGTIESAASFILKNTLTADDAPTGEFYSNDIEEESGISPW